jgi:hypothetical protein
MKFVKWVKRSNREISCIRIVKEICDTDDFALIRSKKISLINYSKKYKLDNIVKTALLDAWNIFSKLDYAEFDDDTKKKERVWIE